MLTVDEAARMSGRNPETIRRWIRSGRLRARKFGTQHMIDDDDFGSLLNERGIEAIPWASGRRDAVEVAGRTHADRQHKLAEVVAPYRTRPEEGSRAQPASEWLPAIVGRIVRIADPVRVVLFGSRATGHARPDSDYDLLVVLDEVANRRATRIALLSALADLPISKDVVVATRAEAEEDGAGPSGVVHWALAEGQTVYERP